MTKKRLKPEEILYKLKTEVEEAYFGAQPVKVFPDDFLSAKVKKELAEPIDYPNLSIVKSGISITGREHKIRRKITKNKINLAQIKKACEIAEKMSEAKGAKYTEVLLPSGKLRLTAERRFGIGFEKGSAFMEFDYLEMGKYLLYSRKARSTSSGQARSTVRQGSPQASSGQAGQLLYKVPKSEIVVKRAVQRYEKYIKETRSGLVKAFMEKGANKKGVEGLAGLVMGDLRLQIIDYRFLRQAQDKYRL